MEPLPPARPGTALQVLATTDLAGTLVPFRTSYGQGGSCAGVAGLLERERDRQPTVWLDAGDFTVGPTAPLLGERPWADMAALPIAASAAGCGGTGPACRPGSASGRGSRSRSRSCPGSCPAWPSCWGVI